MKRWVLNRRGDTITTFRIDEGWQAIDEVHYTIEESIKAMGEAVYKILAEAENWYQLVLYDEEENHFI